jgi:hypothetical protein
MKLQESKQDRKDRGDYSADKKASAKKQPPRNQARQSQNAKPMTKNAMAAKLAAAFKK